MIKKFGKGQVMKFMDSWGGFPIITGSSWEASKFNRSNFILDHSELFIRNFNLGISIQKIDKNSSVYHFYVSFDVNDGFSMDLNDAFPG